MNTASRKAPWGMPSLSELDLPLKELAKALLIIRIPLTIVKAKVVKIIGICPKSPFFAIFKIYLLVMNTLSDGIGQKNFDGKK